MRAALARRLFRRMQRKAEERQAPRTPGSGAAACACDVIRPPNDLPPAISGSFGNRFAASATAARTAACASFGGSGRLLPRSM